MAPKNSDALTRFGIKKDTFPQGVLCRSPWLVLARFCLHFDRPWHPFGSLLGHFGSIIEHVGSIFWQKPSLWAPEYAEHLQITADTPIEGIVHP